MMGFKPGPEWRKTDFDDATVIRSGRAPRVVSGVYAIGGDGTHISMAEYDGTYVVRVGSTVTIHSDLAEAKTAAMDALGTGP